MSLLSKLRATTETSKKRVGRGFGSGKGGHTAGRGTKGQKSRQGANIPIWFEGGQLPLVKRLPFWRGKGRFQVVRPTAEITLNDIEKMQAKVITLDALKEEKVIDRRFKKAKIIATGQLSRKVTVSGIPCSKQAAQLIEKAGGKIEPTA